MKKFPIDYKMLDSWTMNEVKSDEGYIYFNDMIKELLDYVGQSEEVFTHFMRYVWIEAWNNKAPNPPIPFEQKIGEEEFYRFIARLIDDWTENFPDVVAGTDWE